MHTGLSLEATLSLLAALSLGYATLVTRRYSQIYKSRALTFIEVGLFALAIDLFMISIAVQFHIPWIYLARLGPLAVTLITLEYGLNLLQFGRSKSLRFGFSTAIGGMLITSAIFLGDVETIILPSGILTYNLTAPTSWFYRLTIAWIIITYTSFARRLYINAGKKMKVMARNHYLLILIGATLTASIIFSGLNDIIPGLEVLMIGIIILGSFFLISQQPKLFFITPERPIKLMVMEPTSGNSIFVYDWQEEELFIPTPLFMTALESIHLFINQSLNRGKLKTIHLENAVMLIHHEPASKMSFVLMTNSTSYLLEQSFQEFITKFKEIKDAYYVGGSVVMIQNMDALNLMVESIFV